MRLAPLPRAPLPSAASDGHRHAATALRGARGVADDRGGASCTCTPFDSARGEKGLLPRENTEPGKSAARGLMSRESGAAGRGGAQSAAMRLVWGCEAEQDARRRWLLLV